MDSVCGRKSKPYRGGRRSYTSSVHRSGNLVPGGHIGYLHQLPVATYANPYDYSILGRSSFIDASIIGTTLCL